MSLVLIDAGPLIAYYNRTDRWHKTIKRELEKSTCRLITTSACITEVMWALKTDYRVQNEFLIHLARGLYNVEPLNMADFLRIAELNKKYSDLPADFADLSIIVIAERLDITGVMSLDQDFNVYRRYGTKPFDLMPKPAIK